jgi:hypothetical protein
MPYLLDANVFIEAKNRHYGLDFCPAFWDWLIDRHKAGVIFSIDKVKQELLASQDELSTWAAGCDKTFFSPIANNTTAAAMAAVSQWATGQSYQQSAVNEFLGKPDYYLVAHGLATQLVVVTHEKKSPSLKKIKIPDACAGVGVECKTPFEMLSIEGARFRMGAHGPRKP